MADEATPQQKVPLIYANNMAATAGPIELSMDFGYQPPNGDASSATWAIRIAMAWEHVKLVHDMLGKALEQYEANVGEIRDLQKIMQVAMAQLEQAEPEKGGGA
jgi:hypothetical protein